jgi:hypothetical protein
VDTGCKVGGVRVELCASYTFLNGAALSTGTHLLIIFLTGIIIIIIIITVTSVVHSWI